MDKAFLEHSSSNKKEAKWNLFKFQEHIIEWINISAHLFHRGEYGSSLDALTNVYTDASALFSDKEDVKKIDESYKKVRASMNEFVGFYRKKDKIRKQPTQYYEDLIEFRKLLMRIMAKYQLLIPIINKGSEGAFD